MIAITLFILLTLVAAAVVTVVILLGVRSKTRKENQVVSRGLDTAPGPTAQVEEIND